MIRASSRSHNSVKSSRNDTKSVPPSLSVFHRLCFISVASLGVSRWLGRFKTSSTRLLLNGQLCFSGRLNSQFNPDGPLEHDVQYVTDMRHSHNVPRRRFTRILAHCQYAPRPQMSSSILLLVGLVPNQMMEPFFSKWETVVKISEEKFWKIMEILDPH